MDIDYETREASERFESVVDAAVVAAVVAAVARCFFRLGVGGTLRPPTALVI